MAAQPIVRTSIEDPIGTFASNVMGTAHLLQALRKPVGADGLLWWSPRTRSTPMTEPDRAFVETDALGGKDPYSASKAAAEIITPELCPQLFREGLEFLLATARGGNVIGGGDYLRDRLVADIVRAGVRPRA